MNMIGNGQRFIISIHYSTIAHTITEHFKGQKQNDISTESQNRQ